MPLKHLGGIIRGGGLPNTPEGVVLEEHLGFVDSRVKQHALEEDISVDEIPLLMTDAVIAVFGPSMVVVLFAVNRIGGFPLIAGDNVPFDMSLKAASEDSNVKMTLGKTDGFSMPRILLTPEAEAQRRKHGEEFARDYIKRLAAEKDSRAHIAEAPTEIQDSLRRFRADHPEPDKVAFIMMEFGTTPAHNKIVQGIHSAVTPKGITALRADDKLYHDALYYNVLTYIYGCGLGIAVFERLEDEEFNPNVSLEVGYMLALGKPICFLKDQTLRTLQTDLVGKLYSPFDPQDPVGTISEKLTQWLDKMGIG